MQHRQPRHRVHRGADEVKVVTDTNHVRVGKLVVEKRISECAVAVVGGPCSGRCGEDKHGKNERDGSPSHDQCGELPDDGITNVLMEPAGSVTLSAPPSNLPATPRLNS